MVSAMDTELVSTYEFMLGGRIFWGDEIWTQKKFLSFSFLGGGGGILVQTLVNPNLKYSISIWGGGETMWRLKSFVNVYVRANT